MHSKRISVVLLAIAALCFTMAMIAILAASVFTATQDSGAQFVSICAYYTLLSLSIAFAAIVIIAEFMPHKE